MSTTTLEKINMVELAAKAIISHEESQNLLFQHYEDDHVWTDKNGKARRGIFVFATTPGGIPRHYTLDYLIAEYGI
jgi:hypothetical protein